MDISNKILTFFCVGVGLRCLHAIVERLEDIQELLIVIQHTLEKF